MKRFLIYALTTMAVLNGVMLAVNIYIGSWYGLLSFAGLALMVACRQLLLSLDGAK